MASGDIVFDGNILGLQRFGGVSAYLARIASGVFASGHSVKLTHPRLSLYAGPCRDELSRIPVSSVDLLPARVAQYCRTSGLQTNSIFHSAYYRRPARPVSHYVVTVHDFTYERYRKGMARLLHGRLKRQAIEAADSVICISEATRMDVLNFLPSVDKKKLVVIPHGIDQNLFFPDFSNPLPEMNRTVLFVGQRSWYKRFDLAVDALVGLPELRLGIVGPALGSDEKLNLEEKLSNRWTHFGAVSVDQLRRLYSTAYAFIFPSDYEGFGLPMLEAMACGCPIVAARRGALPEVGGDAARYAESQSPDAYIEQLIELSGAAYRAELPGKYEAIVSSMTWERSIAAHCRVYEA